MNKRLFTFLLILLPPFLHSGDDLSSLLKEKASFAERQKTVNNLIKDKLHQLLPKGNQTYGTFTWSTEVSSYFILLKAKDGTGKLNIQIEYKYYTEIPERHRKGFTKTCAGYPAKRFKNTWAWLLLGNTELRLSLKNKDLESDEIIDSIFNSINLNAIEKL